MLCSFFLKNLLILEKTNQFMPHFPVKRKCLEITKFHSYLVLSFIVIIIFKSFFCFVCLKFYNIVYLLLLLSISLLSGSIKINPGSKNRSNKCTVQPYIIIFKDYTIILKIFKLPVINMMLFFSPRL